MKTFCETTCALLCFELSIHENTVRHITFKSENNAAFMTAQLAPRRTPDANCTKKTKIKDLFNCLNKLNGIKARDKQVFPHS